MRDRPEHKRVDYTQQEIDTISSKLNKPLGPEYISVRQGPGGSKLTYLEGWKAISIANEVFGFNGWTHSIVDQTVDFMDERDGRIALGVSCIVRVTLKDGTFHEDVGYGSIEGCRSKSLAFDKVKKEAATDALKRALKAFGNCLGNCLYDKNYMKVVSKVKVPPLKPVEPENMYRSPLYYEPKPAPPIPHPLKPPAQQLAMSDEFDGT
ncbi:hypothetical protein EDD86DRAFT_185688 [Gorgonomyces haynaldii]|nr:hypothetical protein EDD86DRAFT_185688 [Gorgonomyces haynaldii]